MVGSPGTSMGYQGDGLRAWKQNSAGVRTYYLYDGSDPVAELSGSGILQAVNTFGANGLVSRRAASANASTFYTFDERGNVSERLDSSGNAFSGDLYDAFGSHLGTIGTPPDVWGFGAQNGYQTDTETGLLLLTNRYYDPATGRFITRDPIGYRGGKNLYSFVTNNPVSETDSLGLAPNWGQMWNKCKFVVGPGIAIAGLVGTAIGIKNKLDAFKCGHAIQQAENTCDKELWSGSNGDNINGDTPIPGVPDDSNAPNTGAGANALAAHRACVEKLLKSEHLPNIGNPSCDLVFSLLRRVEKREFPVN